MRRVLPLVPLLLVAACSRQVPRSSDWVAALPAGDLKKKLVMSCTPCHQLGTPVARKATEADWLAVFQKMKGIDTQYGTELLLDDLEIPATARWLAQHATVPSRGASVALESAVTREYPFGPVTGFYHDMEFASGRGWAADFFGNVLYGVDPQTAAVKPYPIPLPASAGAHTINRDKAGGIWITFLNTCQVARFDPRTEQFHFFGGFEPGSHVHSFAIDADGRIYEDAQGRVWVTHFTRDYLSRLDPRTGAIERFDLPPTPRLRESQIHPYGVVADSRGILWYTKLHANLLGRLDPATRSTREFVMPEALSGPRRLAVDAADMLWIPEYTTGKVSVFDTHTLQFAARYDLPAPGEYPYGARRNPRTGEIWICGTGSDSLYRFDAKARRFRQYRLPSQVAYTRSISFDESGASWIAYASFPNAHGPYKSGVMVRLVPGDRK